MEFVAPAVFMLQYYANSQYNTRFFDENIAIACQEGSYWS